MSIQHITLAIFAGSFISALIMFYWCEFGKGGVRDLRNKLEAEIELNIGLLNHIEDIELALKNERGTTEELRTLIQNLSPTGARTEGEPLSVQGLSAAHSSFSEVCDIRGHRYEAFRNPTDSIHRLRCSHCGAYSDGAA